jgi:2-dehydro-3-deoxygluconokinase
MNIRPAAECRWDAVSLGEVMLRLDPGDLPTRAARTFTAWEGGGEYNVARALRHVFGLRTAVVTALVDNEVGRLIEGLMLAGGVDLRYLRWLPFDGIGRDARNPLNFTERGFGVRAARGCSDRAHSAASQLRPGDIDWEPLFARDGVRWLHTGGVFAALGPHTPAVIGEAISWARRTGAVVSYDLNYRESLWRAYGGRSAAQAANREIAASVDVLFGNEEDFVAALGYEVEGAGEDFGQLDRDAYRRMIERVVSDYPGLQYVGTSLRGVVSASVNQWGGLLFGDGVLHAAVDRPTLEVFDRVGGGDAFASGVIYALLDGRSPGDAVEYGAAHGALAMTTPGDVSMATLAEVRRVAAGGAARVTR